MKFIIYGNLCKFIRNHKKCFFYISRPILIVIALFGRAELRTLKVLGTSVGLCKTSKRKDQLYISLLVSVWRIISENFNPNGLILAEI